MWQSLVLGRVKLRVKEGASCSRGPENWRSRFVIFPYCPFPALPFLFFFPVHVLNSPSLFPPSQFIRSLAVVKGCGSCATIMPQLCVERGSVTFRWLGMTLLSLLVPSWPCWGDTAVLHAIDFPHATYGFIDIYSISYQAGETYLFNNSQKNLLLAASFSVFAVWDEVGADLQPPRAQGDSVHWLCTLTHW